MKRLRVLLGLAAALAACGAASASAAEPRIVSLAPHLTELAYAAGLENRLVGAVEWSDRPEAAKALPRIGDAFRFDPERILTLDATHALVWVGGTPPAAIEQLADLGLQPVRIETRNLEQIALALETLSALATDDRIGRQAAADFVARLEQLRAQRPAAPTRRVFYQISPRPLFTLGRRHVINEVFELCGAVNVFADLDQEAASVSAEAVLDRAPAAILVGLEADDERGRSLDQRAIEDLNPQLQRFECSEVIGVEAEALVRPTPRILDAAAALCSRLEEVRARQAEPCASTAR